MNPSLLAVQDAAWDLKDITDDLEPRKLSQRDVATLHSVERDLQRLQTKLLGIRDKRKRKGSDGNDEADKWARQERVELEQRHGPELPMSMIESQCHGMGGGQEGGAG